MAATTLVTAEMECIVEDLEDVLDIVLDRRRDVPPGIRQHIAVAIAALIDETKAGEVAPLAFHKRVTALRQEIDACVRLH